MLAPVEKKSQDSAESGNARFRPLVNAAVMTAGVVTVFVTTILWGMQSHGQVDPRNLELLPATPVDATWLAMAAVTVVGLLASAGLPRIGQSGSTVGSAVGQAAAALAAASGTLIGASLGNIWLYGPQDRCVFANCWPADAQAAAAAFPGVLVAALLMVMAVLVARVTWRTRAVVPAAAWLVSIVTLRALWEPLLVPVFQAPTP